MWKTLLPDGPVCQGVTKSMYPTVNGLIGLWDFVIAEGIAVEDSTEATRAFLDRVNLEDLQSPAQWQKLCTLVRLVPNEDIFPVRAEYGGVTKTIGINRLSTKEPLWYTLADCILAKLLTGKCPAIEKAQSYRPGPRQSGLKAIQILGKSNFTIDPNTDDFFTRLVDLQDDAKTNRDSIEKTLKIIANSTSYGIFIEVTRDDAPKSELLKVFGPNGECLDVHTKALEQPGRYFHPLLGVLITGAARLMLGIAELKTEEFGLDWVFCDTDSLAIARPECISRNEFRKRTRQVIDWFNRLNPYRKRESILKIENINYGIGSKEMEPLYCFAISAKRNVLFNLDSSEQPIIRKASAHGLGHLIDPYNDIGAPSHIPKPRVALAEIGVHRWHYDLWFKIIQAAIDGHPDQVFLNWHPALSRPAAMRYTASSPQLLSWVDRWNEGRPYEEQIRPFGFLLAFMPRNGVFGPFSDVLIDESRRGRPPIPEDPAPIAPFDIDPQRAIGKIFDRVTGKPIRPEQLKTYAEVLAQYHLSSEDKFENGQFLDRGRTVRRHIVATGFVWIGKEANQVGESGQCDPIRSAVEHFKKANGRNT